jgi:hypothetical protein
MTYSPNIYRKPWYIQLAPGLDTALGIPADAFVPASKPVGDEWTQIQALYTPLGLDAGLQATINGAPFLRVFPMSDSVRSNDGQAARYEITGTGQQFAPGQVRRRFTIQLNETRAGVLNAIEDSANSGNFGNAAGQIPLIVLDFFDPEISDIKAARLAGYQPYTVRLGGIFELSYPGGTIGVPGGDQFRSTGGAASFTFTEKGLRRAV